MNSINAIEQAAREHTKGKIRMCECCGAKMQQYPHVLNKLLARALLKIYDQNGKNPVRISDILNHNTINNFQKLQYWNLVIKHSEGADRKGGMWSITDLGEMFLQNKIMIAKKVYTFRNQRVSAEGPKIKIGSLEEGYKNRPWYIDNSVPIY